MTYTESARAQLDALQVKDHVCILALETSCDETAAAIIEDGRTIVSNIVFSQIDLHALYGGTRLAEQELNGVLVEDEGGLFLLEDFAATRCNAAISCPRKTRRGRWRRLRRFFSRPARA